MSLNGLLNAERSTQVTERSEVTFGMLTKTRQQSDELCEMLMNLVMRTIQEVGELCEMVTRTSR